jgi:hypothetical protein
MSDSGIEKEHCECPICIITPNKRYKYRKADSERAKTTRACIEADIKSVQNQKYLGEKEYINDLINVSDWMPKGVNAHALTFNKDSTYEHVAPGEDPNRNCYIIVEQSTNQVNVIVVPYHIMSMFSSFAAYHAETGLYVFRLATAKINIIIKALEYCAIYYYNYNTYEELNTAIAAEEYPRPAMEYLISLDYFTRKDIINQCTIVLQFDNLITKCYTINDQEYREKYAAEIVEDQKYDILNLNRNRVGEEYEFGEIDPNSPKGDRIINRVFNLNDPNVQMRMARNYFNDYTKDTHFLQLPHYYSALEYLKLGDFAQNFCVWYDKLVRGETNPEYTPDFEDPRTKEQYFHGAAKHTITDIIPGNPNDIDLVAILVDDPENYVAMSRYYFEQLHQAKDNPARTAEIHASRRIGVKPEPGKRYVVLIEVPRFVTHNSLNIRQYIEQTSLHTAHPLYVINPLDEKMDDRAAYTPDDVRRVLSAVAMKWFEHVFHNNMTFHNDAEIGAAIDRDFYSRFDTGNHIFFDYHGSPLWPYDRYIQMSAAAKMIGYYYWAVSCINKIDFTKEDSVTKHAAAWLVEYLKNYTAMQKLTTDGVDVPSYYHIIV